jgi:hypothetical protein
MPALPALRAATVAIALTLGGLTAFRVLDDPPQTGPVAEQSVRESTSAIATNVVLPTFTISVPTSTATVTSPSIAQKAPPSDESAAGAAAPAEETTANAQADESAASSLSATEDQETNPASDTSGADSARSGDDAAATDANSVMVAMEAATPEPTASPSPSPSPAPTETVTPAPTPSVAVTRRRVDDDSWIGNAQWVLGALLFCAAAVTAGLTIARRKTPYQE